MDLRSDFPFWLLRNGIIRSYPSLQENIQTEIVIMGGGISEALMAWYLIHAGRNVVLVDRRHIAMGSTAASTSLLQYEIDVPLCQLVKKIGWKKAARSYFLCREAIRKIADISDKTGNKDAFAYRPSFQFASIRKHKNLLEKEYAARERIGIPVTWMTESDIRINYGFSSSAGILSEDGGEADAYRLTHDILGDCTVKGLAVYDHTDIVHINHQKRGVALLTAAGKSIKAKKLVIACGYESQRYISKKVQELNSTYVIISEPFNPGNFWYRNSLIWETKVPYLYLQTTADHRIIVGGKDIATSNPSGRDKMLNSKARSLERAFSVLFPSLTFRSDFKWAGSYAFTKDGLPYIGTIPERPHTFFALGLGGNGITFSLVAAEIICDALKGKKNNDAVIFAFDR